MGRTKDSDQTCQLWSRYTLEPHRLDEESEEAEENGGPRLVIRPRWKYKSAVAKRKSKIVYI